MPPFFPSYYHKQYNYYVPNPNSYIKKDFNQKNLNNNYKVNNSEKHEEMQEHKEIKKQNIKLQKKPLNFNFNGFSEINNPIIELFGIKLYSDDIIILIILFLLYNEHIKDDMLFICLLLLLIS
jgi:recombination DNA repair RAD52 pathway protein